MSIVGSRAERGTSRVDRIEVRESACRVVNVLVAAAFGVPLEALRSVQRGSSRTALARQAAMYLAHVMLGMTITEVGQRFGRDRTTVAHACRTIEDKRDDPQVERLLSFLEEALVTCLGSEAQR